MGERRFPLGAYAASAIAAVTAGLIADFLFGWPRPSRADWSVGFIAGMTVAYVFFRVALPRPDTKAEGAKQR